MRRYFSLPRLMAIISLLHLGAPANESNILRLSRNQKEMAIGAKDGDFDATNRPSDAREKVQSVATEGSSASRSNANNFEHDWKNDLRRRIDAGEQIDKEFDVDFTKETLERTNNSIQWLVDIYDPLKWKKVPGKLGERCDKEMNEFLRSLTNGELWAARMSDASGRYSSQLHFGNGFWLGSRNLCKTINDTYERKASGRSERGSPPYPVRFYVTKIYLILPEQLELPLQQILLGLCLPSSCDPPSVGSMLRASGNRVEIEGSNSTYRSGAPKIHIANIKSVPSSAYRVWLDTKFHVLVGVYGTIVLLMIWAAIYEYRKSSSLVSDVETLSAATNSNERVSEITNKNLNQDHKISMVQDNGEELIEKTKKMLQDGASARAKHDASATRFWEKCLLAFNPIANGAKIISTESAARDNLTCIHGLRVFSLIWVIMVHTCLQVFAVAENKRLRTLAEGTFMFQTISNASFSVDTFFFISGLLVTIMFYRSLGGLKSDKGNFWKGSASRFFVMIVYRFVRLTPAYLFVLGIQELVLRNIEAQSVFMPPSISHEVCAKFWWRNALYLNSLYPRTEMCMLWTWYMANDTQFYVLGILLLFLSVRYVKTVMTAIMLIIVSSWVTSFSIAYSNNYVARIQEPFALFDELYDKPWLRAGPYFVGTITGYILFKCNYKLKMSLGVRVIGWLLSISTMLSLVYGLYPGNLSVLTSSMYATLGHTAWAMAVAFIVLQCCTGTAKVIDSILSLRLIYPLSRLSYCAYLLHPIIMEITLVHMDGPLHLHDDLVIIIFFGNAVASYLMSFCISIALEAPVVNLLKIVFTSKKTAR